MIVADLHNEEYVSPSNEDSKEEKKEGPDEEEKQAEQKLLRDNLLSNLKMYMQSRTTVWEIDNPKKSKMFSEISESTLEQMST